MGKGYFFWCGVPLFPSSLHLSSHTPMVCDPFVPFHAVFHRDSPYLHFQIVRPLLVVCSIQMPIVAFGFSISFAFTLLGLISFREHRWICVHYLLTSHMLSHGINNIVENTCNINQDSGSLHREIVLHFETNHETRFNDCGHRVNVLTITSVTDVHPVVFHANPHSVMKEQ